MKLKISVLVSFFLMCGLSSCIDDESSMGGLPVPQLEIAGSASEKLPVLNFDLGVECVIDPKIAYEGGDENSLTYEWSVGTYQEASNGNPAVKGPLELVSTERVLKYYFTDGGSYYAHLKVTDGKVGAVMEYQVNMNRTFEKGYVLVSNDDQGNGNLTFVKDMTPEELAAGKPQLYVEHCIEKMNDGLPVKNLIGVARKDVYQISSGTSLKRLLAITESACYFLDPNRFTVVTDLAFDNATPGFKASTFVSEEYYPFVYDKDMRKFIHLESEQMYMFENPKFEGAFCEDCFIGRYSSYYGASAEIYYVNYATSEVGQSDMNTGAFASTQDLLKDQDILSVFVGPDFGYGKAAYAMVRAKQEPARYALYKINSITNMSSGYEKKEFSATDGMALPTQGTAFPFSSDNSRYYYHADNCVYVYLPNSLEFPNKTQYAIQYAAGTEVTYLDINPETDELYVATYDKAKKRGSFYIYDAKDVSLDNRDHVKPKAAHVDCADRISFVMYKPSM